MAFILSNLIEIAEKFEPIMKDWNSHHEEWERKLTITWVSDVSSFLLSQSMLVTLWIRFHRELFLGLFQHLTHCNIFTCFLISTTNQWVLWEWASYSFYLFSWVCQCLHHYIACTHNWGVNKQMSKQISGKWITGEVDRVYKNGPWVVWIL